MNMYVSRRRHLIHRLQPAHSAILEMRMRWRHGSWEVEQSNSRSGRPRQPRPGPGSALARLARAAVRERLVNHHMRVYLVRHGPH